MEPACLQPRPTPAEMAGVDGDPHAGEGLVGGRGGRRQCRAPAPEGGREGLATSLVRGEPHGVEVVERHACLADDGGLRVNANECLPAAAGGVEGSQCMDELLAGDRLLVRVEAAVVRYVAQGAEVLRADGQRLERKQASANNEAQRRGHGRNMPE